MRKYFITCDCGERLQVPFSALGRTGICKTCGRKLHIMPDLAQSEEAASGAAAVSEDALLPSPEISEEMRQRFGRAVDLFQRQQYAEALAVFDAFDPVLPGNPEIRMARDQCLSALRKKRLIDESQLDEATVRRVVLDKLLCSPSEAVQLQAASLACRILGLFADRPAKADEANEADEAGEADEANEANPWRAKPIEKADPPVNKFISLSEKQGPMTAAQTDEEDYRLPPKTERGRIYPRRK
jgi:hypothetical protein